MSESEEKSISTYSIDDSERVLTIEDISINTGQKYTMKHATEILGISDGTIRNWEKELSEFLTFERDSQGTRQFTGQDIYKLKAINELREAGMSLALIKKQLEIQRANRVEWGVSEGFSGVRNSNYEGGQTGLTREEFQVLMQGMLTQIKAYIDSRSELASSRPLLADPDQKDALLNEVKDMIQDQFQVSKAEIQESLNSAITSVSEVVKSELSRVEKYREEQSRNKSFWRRIFG